MSSLLHDIPICPLCNGTRWKPFLDENNVERVTRCDCWRSAHRQHAIDVPVGEQESLLANFLDRPGTTTARRAALEYLSGVRRDLFFYGPCGSGKTRLACSLLNEQHRRGKTTAQYIYVPSLLTMILRGIRGEEAEAEANRMLHLAGEADVLCLDDLAGGEKDSDFSRRTLVTLYQERINKGLSTIWTSNFDLDGIKAFYNDDRLPSRIAGGCGDQIEFTAGDYRVEGLRR